MIYLLWSIILWLFEHKLAILFITFLVLMVMVYALS